MPPVKLDKPQPFPKPYQEPRAGINPVKPGVGNKSQDMKKRDMLKRDMLKKDTEKKLNPAPRPFNSGGKPPSKGTTGPTPRKFNSTLPMKPDIKTKNAPMPYKKDATKKLSRGFGN
jgi:hypothetical protein